MPMRIQIKPGFVASVCLMAWVDSGLCLYFLLALTCHELGHALAMLLLGVPIGGLQIGLSGAVLSGSFPSYGKELLCALAGPLAGLLATLVSYGWAAEFAVVSLCLSAVNLLPLYPMDGGRILRAVLSLNCELETITRVLRVVSGIVCCLLMVGACWVVAELQSGLWPIFAVLAILWRAGTASVEKS